jgi:hypothetical protein
MPTPVSTHMRVVALAVLAGHLWAGGSSADAATITVSGVFTGYEGPAGGCGQYTTIINQVDVTPSVCDPSTFFGQIDIGLGDTPAVEFYGNQFGTDLTHNALAFVPAGPQEIGALGQEILLGYLQYTNGTWFGIGEVGAFDLRLTTSSSDPLFDGHTLVDKVLLLVTPTDTTASPEQNADFVYFATFSTLGSFRVYESFDSPTGSNTGLVPVYGTISSIIPTRFGDAQGAGFVDPGISLEPTSVPEPGTQLLMTSALAVALRRWQRIERARRR